MRIAATLPEHAQIVEAVLDGFVQAAQLMVESGVVPPHPRDAGVRYQEEHGTENWLLPHQVIAAGWGDCEDLALWAAGGYRATGEDAEARVKLLQTGPRRVHAVVQHGDGSYEDVARSLVMRESSVLGAAPKRTGNTTLIRVHAGDGSDKFAGLAPAAAPADGGTPGTAAQQAEGAIAQWMREHGKTSVSVSDTYQPSAGDRAPAEYQALAQRLAEAMRAQSYDPRSPASLQQQYAAQEGMAAAAALGESYDPRTFGQSKRNANPAWAQQPPTDEYGNPIDPTTGMPVDAYGNPIDPYTGMPLGSYGYGYGSPYGSPYGGADAYMFMQQFGGEGQGDYDYQALADELYSGVTGLEQQPWQVDVDGDLDVDADDMAADWIG